MQVQPAQIEQWLAKYLGSAIALFCCMLVGIKSKEMGNKRVIDKPETKIGGYVQKFWIMVLFFSY